MLVQIVQLAATEIPTNLEHLLMACFTRLASSTTFFSLLMLTGTSQAKTLVYCSEASPETFTPAIAIAESTMDASAKTIFNRLVDFKPGTTEIVPSLAESWEVSQDGKIYTFHLRKGVKFQSNDDFTPTRDFNADDVLYTFNRQRDPQNPYYNLGGARYEYFESQGLRQLLKAIEKVDDYTVRFTLTEANVAFLPALAIDYLSILSLEQTEAYVKAGRPEKLDQTPVGTGPFRLIDYQTDSVIRYKANDSYWKGKPQIDTLIFAIATDPTVRVQKLQAGECDTTTQPTASDLETLKRNPNINVVTLEGQNVGFLGFNVQRAPFNDVKVRTALAKAIDRRALVDAVYLGNGARARGLLPPLMVGAATNADPNSYDPDSAKALLKEAGHESDLSVSIWSMPVSRPYNPNARRMAELIQADWQAVGVKSQIVTMEWGEYLKRTSSGEQDVFLLGGTSDNGDPDNLMSYMLSCDSVNGGSNRSRWCSPDFDKLLNKARTEQDRSKRAAIYVEAQSIIDAEVPLIPIAHSRVSVPISKRVTHYALDAFGRQNFESYDVSE